MPPAKFSKPFTEMSPGNPRIVIAEMASVPICHVAIKITASKMYFSNFRVLSRVFGTLLEEI